MLEGKTKEFFSPTKPTPKRSSYLQAPEFGVKLPESTKVRVHDSTADLRYIVLPQRPAGTEGWSKEQLMSLVSRDSMIGAAMLHKE